MKRILPLVLLLLLAGPVAVHAQDADAKAEAASLVDTAKPLLERGGYFDAISNLKKALAADPRNAEAALLLAGAYRDTGELAKALELLTPLDAPSAALTLRAEIQFARGDDSGAQATAKTAVEEDPLALGALIVIGRVQEATGRREEAIGTYEEVNRRWSKTDEAQESDDVLLADARARLGIFRLSSEHRPDINSVLSRLDAILKRSPARVDAAVECGDVNLLYMDGKMDLEAKKWFGRALEKNPHYAPALFGRARQLAFRYEDIEAARICEEQVLRENPSYVPALLYLAQQALGDGNHEKAAGLIDRALAVNPSATETRATHATLLYLRGDGAGYESEVKAILARDKFAAAAYSVPGRVLEQQRRFAEALAFAEKAVAIDAQDWDAHFLAGRNALNVGEDEKAQKYLTAAEKGDAFANLYRSNFLKLFQQTRNFAVVRDPTFVVRIPPEEEEPYYRLLRTRMGESIELLQKKWDFRVELPIYASVFARQEDFATRTIGLPGFPALGACFGRVVTLDSPRCLPTGAFLWSDVQHHELAHVVTLQLSKGRVPRWLTEGASVYEERRYSRIWERDDQRDLIDAIASDEVLTLKGVNNAFRGPRVMYAYYQGGLMCEWIEKDFGFAKLPEMVRLYGEDGADDANVVKRVLGIGPAEFDARFLAWAKDFVKDIRVLRRPSKQKCDKLRRALRKTPEDAESWLLLAEGSLALGDVPGALSALSNAGKKLPQDGRIPQMRALIAWRENKPDQAVKHAEEALAKGADLYELRMGLAEEYAKPGRDAEKAKEHWRRAIELFAFQKGPGDPRLALTKQLMAEGEKNLEAVVALLRAHVDMDEDDLGTRRQLAAIYAQDGKADDELAMLEQMRDIAPLPNVGPNVPPPARWRRDAALAIHERLGEMYLERKRYPEAELAWACAVGVARMELQVKDEPVAPPAALAELLAHHAEALHLIGRDDAARARVEEAKRLDPENEAVRKAEQSLPAR